MRQTRPISWIKAVRKDFEKFPIEAQDLCLAALTDAVESRKSPRRCSDSGLRCLRLPFPIMGTLFVSSMRCGLQTRFGWSMRFRRSLRRGCLLYTSAAADDL